MSDQRKVRQELRQGLHQFLMHMYTSYSESNSEVDAKGLVLESIEEQYAFFSPDTIATKSTKEVINSKVEELTKIMDQQADYDSQLYYAEKIDILKAAIEVLDFKL